MVSKTTIIKNPSGLHLQPAGALYKEVLHYKSKISSRVHTTTVNVKSVSNALEACMKSGNEIEFVCEGPGEKEAPEVVVGIVEAGLDE